MTDYSVTGYNPNNAYDTLYARQNQNIVVSDSIPQATTRTNYAKVSLETPPDTFELSAESKIKRQICMDRNSNHIIVVILCPRCSLVCIT